MTIKDTIRVCGLKFTRCPAHENRLGRWDYVDYSRGKVLSIRLDVYQGGTQCSISVGSTNDKDTFRGFNLKYRARSRRRALQESVDLASYSLAVAGFRKLEAQILRGNP